MPTTRFAPSPTGYLHIGHAYAALFAAKAAKDGTFLLRIEDIDRERCKPEFTQAIFEDLRWLGLSWAEPVRRQSEHMNDYAAALQKLRDMELVYPCFCSRREIELETSRAGAAPHAEDGTILYPGTCRHMSQSERAEKLEQFGTANWRLDVAAAVRRTGALVWNDLERGTAQAHPSVFGDVVLARKDVPTSYHLSATVDDHIQNVTLVTRGEDLFASTHVHRLLQALLGYEPPDYHHHKLLLDPSGKRFAKRDAAVTLREMREAGRSSHDILQDIGWLM